MENVVTIKKESLQQLLDNFWTLCLLCDELNIYEWEEADKDKQQMEEWVVSTFGRKEERI